MEAVPILRFTAGFQTRTVPSESAANRTRQTTRNKTRTKQQQQADSSQPLTPSVCQPASRSSVSVPTLPSSACKPAGVHCILRQPRSPWRTQRRCPDRTSIRTHHTSSYDSPKRFGTTAITGWRELTLISGDAGHRHSGAWHGSSDLSGERVFFVPPKRNQNTSRIHSGSAPVFLLFSSNCSPKPRNTERDVATLAASLLLEVRRTSFSCSLG